MGWDRGYDPAQEAPGKGSSSMIRGQSRANGVETNYGSYSGFRAVSASIERSGRGSERSHR